MRVIITGGTGLIGTALAQSLAQDGHEVFVLSRNPAQASLPKGVQAAAWDGKTAVSWAHLADGADAIVNLAGENLAGKGLLPQRWTAERKQRIIASRLNAGRAVVEAVQLAQVKPRVVIQSSGIDYYGDRGDELITEATAPVDSGFLSRLTVEWEEATAAVEEQGVRRVTIRTAVVLSPDGGPLATMALPFKFFVGGPLGGGRQWLSWIHIRDEVRAIRFLIDHESAAGAFNLCAPEPLTYSAFSKVLGKVVKRPSFLPVPAFAMKLLFGEVSEAITQGRRALPQRLLDMGFTFQYPTAEAALQDLLG
jgi:uncharacterized protein